MYTDRTWVLRFQRKTKTKQEVFQATAWLTSCQSSRQRKAAIQH